LPAETVLSGREIEFFRDALCVPVVSNGPGTIIAANVGGAIIPTRDVVLPPGSRHRLWFEGGLADGGGRPRVCMARASGAGHGEIALPIFVPRASRRLSRLLPTEAAASAYIAAAWHIDSEPIFLNLDRVSGLGAPIASDRRAGSVRTAIFVTGVLAVLLASFFLAAAAVPHATRRHRHHERLGVHLSGRGDGRVSGAERGLILFSRGARPAAAMNSGGHRNPYRLCRIRLTSALAEHRAPPLTSGAVYLP